MDKGQFERWEDFDAIERVVILDALDELVESCEDPESAPWKEQAKRLYEELNQTLTAGEKSLVGDQLNGTGNDRNNRH